MREIQTRTNGPVYFISRDRKKILDVLAEALEEGKTLSNKQLAERAGVSLKTVQRFLKDESHGGVLQASLNYLVESNLTEIFGALIRKSKAGNAKSQELLFKTIGLLREQKENITYVFNLFNEGEKASLTDADISALLGGNDRE